MALHNLPSPPSEESKTKKHTSTKPIKPTHRASKRSSSSAASVHHHDHITQSTGMQDSRHKRVWKACERCRMKKTKCDGEFPCKRCKDDGLVCTAGLRKKVEYKQLPRGYAEVLESTQLTLIATVHKLYSMVRNSQSWDLGEPDLNDRGLPIVHNIADKLGCIRPNGDIDLPIHSVFPEDEASMAELARQLEDQQQHQHQQPHETVSKDSVEFSRTRNERASSSDLDHSDFELDYRKLAFGSHNTNALSLSPQSYAGSHDFEFGSATTDLDQGGMFTSPSSSSLPNFSSSADWSLPKTTQQGNTMAMQYIQQDGNVRSIDLLSQGGGLLDSDFNTIKPENFSVSNAEVMMGLGDPMIYAGFDTDMRL